MQKQQLYEILLQLIRKCRILPLFEFLHFFHSITRRVMRVSRERQDKTNSINSSTSTSRVQRYQSALFGKPLPSSSSPATAGRALATKYTSSPNGIINHSLNGEISRRRSRFYATSLQNAYTRMH